MTHSGESVREHSVAGLVTIRLLGASSSVMSALRADLGQSTGETAGEADITVRFVDSLGERPSYRLLDRNQAAYDDEHFYLLDPNGARTRIDLTQAGGMMDITCEKTVTSVPLLLPLVGLRMIEKNAVLLHSGAVVVDGSGVLVTGFKKGGKTETILPFMMKGAGFVSDEWTAVTAEGHLSGLAGIVHLWAWHLRQYPELERRLPSSDQRRIRAVRGYQRLYRALPLPSSGPIGRRMRRLSEDGGVPAVAQARVLPEQIFGDRVIRGSVPVARVLLPSVGVGPIRAESIHSSEVAARMVASLAYERSSLETAYQMFQFAFPDRVNNRITSAMQHERRILDTALAGIPAHEVVHPYPVSLEEMHQIVRPLCS